MNILIVEDDTRIASFLAKGLRDEGYVASVAHTAEQAESLISLLSSDIDLVLLDLGLPDEDGYALLRAWRERSLATQVIILTARDRVEDKIRGLDAGANDYMTKPFAFAELLARIRAALRSTDQSSSARLTVNDLTLDLETKVAWRAKRRIDLAPREWALLELFMRNPSHILSRTQILSHVWDYSFDPGSNIVDVYVGYLRRKLNAPGLQPMILTIRGAGYRLLAP
jgi:two-component system, OmpR family, response regulator